MRFIGAETPHKKTKPDSAYIYKLYPKAYFGENPHPCSNTPKIGTNANHRPAKIARKASQRDEPNLEAEHEDLAFPPQNNRLEVSSILIEDTREVNIGSSKIPKLVHIAASLSDHQVDLLLEVLRENIGQFA